MQILDQNKKYIEKKSRTWIYHNEIKMIDEVILLLVSPYYITMKTIKRKKRKGKGNKSIAAHENIKWCPWGTRICKEWSQLKRWNHMPQSWKRHYVIKTWEELRSSEPWASGCREAAGDAAPEGGLFSLHPSVRQLRTKVFTPTVSKDEKNGRPLIPHIISQQRDNSVPRIRNTEALFRGLLWSINSHNKGEWINLYIKKSFKLHF